MLDHLLGQRQAWTVTTLSEALAAEADIHLKPRTVRHRQDPALATAAGAMLAGLKKSVGTGSWTSSSSTKPASAPPCRPPIPGVDRACAPSSPTKTPRADA